MPKAQQLPGESTPDINQILTQIAEEHQSGESSPVPEQEIVTPDVPTNTPEPTATPKKIETLTVCLGKEPETLFFYAESSQAMWSVLESIYDGPFDTGDGEIIPVIFEDISVMSKPDSPD